MLKQHTYCYENLVFMAMLVYFRVQVEYFEEVCFVFEKRKHFGNIAYNEQAMGLKI